MAEFDAIDALLAAAGRQVPLPPAEERRSLREGLNLARPQLAQALGVSASTVAGWESGREPGGEVREKYAYFLEGARTKLDAAEAGEAPADAPTSAPPRPRVRPRLRG
jgi:transcriptional regulator with XRE-family HTH domain